MPTYEVTSSAPEVPCALEEALTPDSIVMIALQNNPNLQAEFENIGIAQGDLINAGLFSNPQLELRVRVPNKGGFALNTDYTLTTSVLDFFLRPLRITTAAYARKEACASAAHALLKLAYEAENSYNDLAYAQKLAALHQQKAELAKATLDIAQMQAGCGNISQYSLRNFQIALQNETTALLEAQKNLISLRSTLNLLMGVPDNSALWTIVEPAPYTLHPADLNKNPVEEALEKRYDLQAATYSIYKKAREGQQKQWWSYTDLRLGVSTEQEVEGVQVTGPVVALSLPLFNQGQGDRFRLLHELQQSQQHYEALRERIVVEVNETSDLNKALSTEYLLLKNEAIPTLQTQVNDAQAYYNFMAIGIYDLIARKNEELGTQIHFTEIERDLTKSDARLRFVTGSSL